MLIAVRRGFPGLEAEDAAAQVNERRRCRHHFALLPRHRRLRPPGVLAGAPARRGPRVLVISVVNASYMGLRATAAAAESVSQCE